MILTLPVKTLYFDQIKSGEKKEEYRLYNKYWCRRLLGKSFDRIVITKGYPKSSDTERRISRGWNGLSIKFITHEHFGGSQVKVFAIKVN
jgi:hypothetical protein